MTDLKPITIDELRQSQNNHDALMAVARVLKCDWPDIPDRIGKIRDEIAYLKDEIAKIKGKPCKLP